MNKTESDTPRDCAADTTRSVSSAPTINPTARRAEVHSLNSAVGPESAPTSLTAAPKHPAWLAAQQWCQSGRRLVLYPPPAGKSALPPLAISTPTPVISGTDGVRAPPPDERGSPTGWTPFTATEETEAVHGAVRTTPSEPGPSYPAIPLDADRLTYEMLCTTGVAPLFRGSTAGRVPTEPAEDPSQTTTVQTLEQRLCRESSSALEVEKEEPSELHRSSSSERRSPRPAGRTARGAETAASHSAIPTAPSVARMDVDAVVEVSDTVRLCNLVTLLPRNFPLHRLVQQVIPSITYPSALLAPSTSTLARVGDASPSTSALPHVPPSRSESVAGNGRLDGVVETMKTTTSTAHQTFVVPALSSPPPLLPLLRAALRSHCWRHLCAHATTAASQGWSRPRYRQGQRETLQSCSAVVLGGTRFDFQLRHRQQKRRQRAFERFHHRLHSFLMPVVEALERRAAMDRRDQPDEAGGASALESREGDDTRAVQMSEAAGMRSAAFPTEREVDDDDDRNRAALPVASEGLPTAGSFPQAKTVAYSRDVLHRLCQHCRKADAPTRATENFFRASDRKDERVSEETREDGTPASPSEWWSDLYKEWRWYVELWESCDPRKEPLSPPTSTSKHTMRKQKGGNVKEKGGNCIPPTGEEGKEWRTTSLCAELWCTAVLYRLQAEYDGEAYPDGNAPCQQDREADVTDCHDEERLPSNSVVVDESRLLLHQRVEERWATSRDRREKTAQQHQTSSETVRNGSHSRNSGGITPFSSLPRDHLAAAAPPTLSGGGCYSPSPFRWTPPPPLQPGGPRRCDVVLRSPEPQRVTPTGSSALVEWSTGDVDITVDTEHLEDEQRQRLERTYYLPPTTTLPCAAHQRGLQQHSGDPAGPPIVWSTLGPLCPPQTNMRAVSVEQLHRLHHSYAERCAHLHLQHNRESSRCGTPGVDPLTRREQGTASEPRGDTPNPPPQATRVSTRALLNHPCECLQCGRWEPHFAQWQQTRSAANDSFLQYLDYLLTTTTLDYPSAAVGSSGFRLLRGLSKVRVPMGTLTVPRGPGGGAQETAAPAEINGRAAHDRDNEPPQRQKEVEQHHFTGHQRKVELATESREAVKTAEMEKDLEEEEEVVCRYFPRLAARRKELLATPPTPTSPTTGATTPSSCPSLMYRLRASWTSMFHELHHHASPTSARSSAAAHTTWQNAVPSSGSTRWEKELSWAHDQLLDELVVLSLHRTRPNQPAHTILCPPSEALLHLLAEELEEVLWWYKETMFRETLGADSSSSRAAASSSSLCWAHSSYFPLFCEVFFRTVELYFERHHGGLSPRQREILCRMCARVRQYRQGEGGGLLLPRVTCSMAPPPPPRRDATSPSPYADDAPSTLLAWEAEQQETSFPWGGQVCPKAGSAELQPDLVGHPTNMDHSAADVSLQRCRPVVGSDPLFGQYSFAAVFHLRQCLSRVTARLTSLLLEALTRILHQRIVITYDLVRSALPFGSAHHSSPPSGGVTATAGGTTTDSVTPEDSSWNDHHAPLHHPTNASTDVFPAAVSAEQEQRYSEWYVRNPPPGGVLALLERTSVWSAPLQRLFQVWQQGVSSSPSSGGGAWSPPPAGSRPTNLSGWSFGALPPSPLVEFALLTPNFLKRLSSWLERGDTLEGDEGEEEELEGVVRGDGTVLPESSSGSFSEDQKDNDGDSVTRSNRKRPRSDHSPSSSRHSSTASSVPEPYPPSLQVEMADWWCNVSDTPALDRAAGASSRLNEPYYRHFSSQAVPLLRPLRHHARRGLALQEVTHLLQQGGRTLTWWELDAVVGLLKNLEGRHTTRGRRPSATGSSSAMKLASHRGRRRAEGLSSLLHSMHSSDPRRRRRPPPLHRSSSRSSSSRSSSSETEAPASATAKGPTAPPLFGVTPSEDSGVKPRRGRPRLAPRQERRRPEAEENDTAAGPTREAVPFPSSVKRRPGRPPKYAK